MAFDGIVTRAVINELNNTIKGLRVDKIYQVEKDEVILYFRKHKLLISSSGNNPRMYLTSESKNNPKTPPLFTMVLRKHISGAIVKEIVQYGNDRVLEIKFEGRNDFSEKVEKSLVVEIMGRHSNIILLDENKVIIDSIKRVNDNMSRVREILPHLKYVYLPDLNKKNPLDVSDEEFKSLILNSEANKSIENTLFTNFTGFSKTIGKEISSRADIDSFRPISSLEEFELEKILLSFKDIVKEIKDFDFSYNLYLDGDKIIDFHVLYLKSMEGMDKHSFDTPSELLDKVYTKRDKDDRLGQKSQALKKTVSSKLTKNKSKLSNLKKDLLEAENREKYRIYADLLSANFHKVEPGQKEITVENFYSENLEEIVIPLDEKISAPQNAQKFYKKYNKLKNAENYLNSQIEETKSEIDYLESVILDITMAENLDSLEDTKNELIDQGYIKRRQKLKKKKESSSDYIEYQKDGFKIYLGRNNRENDFLTHKIAKKDDMWFHVQGIPGSHVIVKTDGEVVPESVINYAAKIAAYNSKARNSGNVEVDYTFKKFVKRHPANKPGLVNYTDFNTVLVSSNK